MFDLVRFRRLLNAQWAEQWRAHAWFMGIGVMLHFIVSLMVLSSREGSYTTDNQMMLFTGGLMTTAPLFAARYFHAIARPEAALLFLMRPASGFEKWLLAFLMVLVVYPFAYALAFQLCHMPAWIFEASRVQQMIAEQLANGDGPASDTWIGKYALWMPWEFPEWEIPAVLMLLLAELQAFAVLGSLWFRRFPIAKTVLVAFGLWLGSIVLAELYPRGAPWLADSELAKVWWQHLHQAAYWIGVPVLLWAACYFAMRERELA